MDERSQRRLQLVIGSIRDYAILTLDPTGRIESSNPGVELVKGYRASEIIGQNIERFYTPEDLASNLPRRLLAEAALDGRVENEGWRVRKDGTRFWADVVITALREPDGELVGFVKVTRDLTERMRSEEQRVHLAHVEEAVRLRDEFLAIAAHELRTPLVALQLQIDSLRIQVDRLEPRQLSKLERAGRNVERLTELINSLLDVSRIAKGKLTLALADVDSSARSSPRSSTARTSPRKRPAARS